VLNGRYTSVSQLSSHLRPKMSRATEGEIRPILKDPRISSAPRKELHLRKRKGEVIQESRKETADMKSAKEWELNLWSFRIRNIYATRDTEAWIDRIAEERIDQCLCPMRTLEEQIVINDIEIIASIFVSNQCWDIEQTRESSLWNHCRWNHNNSTADTGQGR
jgi:hypothetical protein